MVTDQKNYFTVFETVHYFFLFFLHLSFLTKKPILQYLKQFMIFFFFFLHLSFLGDIGNGKVDIAHFIISKQPSFGPLIIWTSFTFTFSLEFDFLLFREGFAIFGEAIIHIL